MNPRVKELLDIIKNANEELKKIRSECPHLEHGIGLWSFEHPGNVTFEKICKECQICIGNEIIEGSELWAAQLRQDGPASDCKSDP
jgi:hypothetical protein